MLKNIVAVEYDEEGKISAFPILFEVPSAEFDLISAVRDAAAEYCKTEEGWNLFEYHSFSFNWEDFAQAVPNSICKKHGFQRVDNHLPYIVVDTDERLFEDPDLF